MNLDSVIQSKVNQKEKNKYWVSTHIYMGFPGDTSSKESICQCRRCTRHTFNLWVRKIPWRRAWQPTHYSCLENPMDRGAWWAMVHRVTECQTWLKWLSTQHNPYMWNLEKWYRWTYLQRRIENRQNGLWTWWEGDSGANWESSIDIYTLPCGN